jgi:hypothetical protein
MLRFGIIKNDIKFLTMNNMKTNHQLVQILESDPKKAITKMGMNILHECPALFALVFALFSSLPADAQSVIPTSYSATLGEGISQGGTYNYNDNTGSQLTDGIYGANDWSANLGNCPAYEWVGWLVADPVIAFQFSAPATINQVGIDFNRNQSASILLPTTVTIGGTEFTVDPNAIPDDTQGTLYFNGNWTGAALTVDLMDCNTSNWIFVDEITFSGAAVPEPSVFGLLAGGFGLLILFIGCRKSVGLFKKCSCC